MVRGEVAQGDDLAFHRAESLQIGDKLLGGVIGVLFARAAYFDNGTLA